MLLGCRNERFGHGRVVPPFPAPMPARTVLAWTGPDPARQVGGMFAFGTR